MPYGNLSEDEFTEQVIAIAHWYKWRCAHFRPARTNKGWRTAMQGDVGYPDLSLARGSRIILAELKAEDGKYRDGQREWADAIGPVVYRLWRPSDLHEIKEELR